MSIGEWLQQGCILKGTKLKMAIQQGAQPALFLYPKGPGETIYWIKAKLVRDTKALFSMSTLFQVDRDLMHQRMGHPSDDVLRQAKNHTDKFPQDLIFNKNRPICRGCAEAKMHLPTFEDTPSRASRPFELVHSDLKELPTILYHKYKWFITFFDDYTSYGWVAFLKRKSDAYYAICDFIAMVRNQYEATIKIFMSDGGGEYISEKLLTIQRIRD